MTRTLDRRDRWIGLMGRKEQTEIKYDWLWLVEAEDASYKGGLYSWEN